MALLSKQTVQKILSDDKERKGAWGKLQLAAGEQLMYISSVELTNSKKSNDPMLVIQLSADDEHAPLQENFMLAGNGREVGLQKIVTFIGSAFKHEMEECEDEKALLAAILKFKAKKFKAAIKIQEELYAWEKDGKSNMTVIPKAKLWYCSTADDTGFKVNIANATVPLSAEDKAKYLEFKKANPDAANTNVATEGPKEDPLPF